MFPTLKDCEVSVGCIQALEVIKGKHKLDVFVDRHQQRY